MHMGFKSKQHAEVAILTLDKTEFKPKTAIKGKGGCCIKLRKTIQ